jgi:hypothetical protein
MATVKLVEAVLASGQIDRLILWSPVSSLKKAGPKFPRRLPVRNGGPRRI